MVCSGVKSGETGDFSGSARRVAVLWLLWTLHTLQGLVETGVAFLALGHSFALPASHICVSERGVCRHSGMKKTSAPQARRRPPWQPRSPAEQNAHDRARGRFRVDFHCSSTTTFVHTLLQLVNTMMHNAYNPPLHLNKIRHKTTMLGRCWAVAYSRHYTHAVQGADQ